MHIIKTLVFVLVFILGNALGKTTFVLNSLMCYIMQDSVFTTEIKLRDQNETSYDVKISLFDSYNQYQIVIPSIIYNSIGNKLCTSAFYFFKFNSNSNPKYFSTRMSNSLDVDLNFNIVENSNRKQKKEILGLVKLSNDEHIDNYLNDNSDEDIIEI